MRAHADVGYCTGYHNSSWSYSYSIASEIVPEIVVFADAPYMRVMLASDDCNFEVESAFVVDPDWVFAQNVMIKYQPNRLTRPFEPLVKFKCYIFMAITMAKLISITTLERYCAAEFIKERLNGLTTFRIHIVHSHKILKRPIKIEWVKMKMSACI